MPRVKRERVKYHSTTATTTTTNIPNPISASTAFAPQPTAPTLPIPDLFAQDQASTRLPLTEDTATTDEALLETANNGGYGSKKGKRVERHRKWMEKMQAARVAEKKRRAKAERSKDKSALVRGMDSIKDTLLEINLPRTGGSTSGKKASSRVHVKTDNPVSRKARHKASVNEEKRFVQVLAHPSFKANPLATIREHLSNTLNKQ